MKPDAKNRASGKSPAQEEAEAASDALIEDPNPQLPEERAKKFRAPGFSRMRTTWNPEDLATVTGVREQVEGVLLRQFADLYEVLYDLYEVIREPQTTPEGEIKTDQYGLTLWKGNGRGGYAEKWDRLTRKEKERFLYLITTRLVEWEQRAADLWGEAMLSKSVWEERYAIQFGEPMAGTVDDRNSYANKNAAEERYFAVYCSILSRKADVLVRTMGVLGQRLKDTMEM